MEEPKHQKHAHETEIEKSIQLAVDRATKRIVMAAKKAKRNVLKETEKRLRAYPILRQNISRHEKDIEDIKHETMQRSHDVIMYRAHTGRVPGDEKDLEKLREEKIYRLTEKIHRDEAEVREIENALACIRDSEYYRLIELMYFSPKAYTQDDLAAMLHCDRATLWRNKKKLIEQISVVLYGADAL